MRREIVRNAFFAARIIFAASAMTFATLLIIFVLVLFAKDVHTADSIWRSPLAFMIWAASLIASFKFMSPPKK